MQVRKLGIPVDRTYKRIHSIRKYPNEIQQELVKYQIAVELDSEYEPDEVVLQKHADNPIQYIKKNDDRHRDAIEMNGEPRRLNEAREKLGIKNHEVI